MHLYIDGTSDRITLGDWFMEDDPLYNYGKVEQIEFADGSVWDPAMLESLIVMAEATEGIDEIYGTEGDDTINGLGGEYDELFGNGGNDTLDGGAGLDYLWGGSGNDVYLFGRGSGYDAIAELDATEGNIDTIRFDSTVAVSDIIVSRDQNGALFLSISGTDDRIQIVNWFSGTASLIERIEFHDGTVWNPQDVVSRVTFSGTPNDDGLHGSEANDMVRGFDGNDGLWGDGGSDVIEGGAGSDYLSDDDGYNYFNGGAGDDDMRASDGTGADFFMGGAGNDFIMSGSGPDVIALNVGDGQDTVYEGNGLESQDDTVSLGGAGLDYAGLTLQKNGDDLVLKISETDQLTFTNWYGSAGNQTVLNLQVVTEAMAAFDASSSDPLLNKKVQTFDFQGLVGAFDAARGATPGLSSWALSNSLTQFHLAGSDSEALGGDLAYQYGANGTLAGIGLGKAQEVLTNAQFGAQAQALHSTASLQEGLIRLG